MSCRCYELNSNDQFGLETEHLVEVDFDGFDVGTKELCDGIGVELLGVARDGDDEGTVFDVLGMEGT